MDNLYYRPDTAETRGDFLPGFYGEKCEPWGWFADKVGLVDNEQEYHQHHIADALSRALTFVAEGHDRQWPGGGDVMLED